MKIKDIIKTSSALLGKENVLGYLTDQTTFNDKFTLYEVNLFTTLLNNLLSELAGTYIPMVKTEKVNGATEVYFKNLTENAIRILDVLDFNERPVAYSLTAEKIKANSTFYYVVYEYVPTNYNLEDVIGYTAKDVSKTVLAYGLCAEFCISQARYSEALIFHDKYVNGIEKKQKRKNAKTVARLWR